MYSTVLVQWYIYVHCNRHICLGESASNMKCVHTSVPSLIVGCSDFI